MWETSDPQGRQVLLTFKAWRHICRRHPQMLDEREKLRAALPRAERSVPGREPGEVWHYVSGPGPTRFVKVVVHYEGSVGRIWTAFPRRRFP